MRASEEMPALRCDSDGPSHTLESLPAASLRALLRCGGSDFDAGVGTIVVTGKLVRQRWVWPDAHDESKTAASRRTIPLPSFAVRVVLRTVAGRPTSDNSKLIFASSSGFAS